MKEAKGSISIFTLVTLLFMIGFLIISYANVINNSKSLKEQFSLIKEIYYKSNDSSSYTDVYTDLRKKNRQNLTAYVDNSNTLELEKTFESKLVNYRIYGNTTQSVNLFNINSVTDFYYSNGSKTNISTISDGVITNTVSSGVSYCFMKSNVSVLKAGTYTFSFDVMADDDAGTKQVRVGVLFKDNSSYREYVNITPKQWERKSIKFTIESDLEVFGFNLQGNNGANTNLNVKFKNIQLEKGSTATDYVAYETKSVGNKCKNLLDESLLLENSKISKVTEGYKVAGYPVVFNSTNNLIKRLKETLKPNIPYTLSRKVSNYIGDSSGMIQIRSVSSELVRVQYGDGIRSITFTFTQEQIDSIDNIYIYGRKNSNETIFEYIQLEEGEKATDYIPYGKYRIQIKSENVKNAVNLISVPGFNVTYDDNYFENTTTDFLLQPDCTYTLSFDYKVNSTSRTLYCGVGCGVNIYSRNIKEKQYPNQVNGRHVVTFTTPSDIGNNNFLFIRFARTNSKANVNVDISSVQLEYGETATDYVPYKEQVSSVVNIYLDEPLRKIGNYADYIDFRKQCIARNTGVDSNGNLYSLSETVYESIALPELPAYEDYTKIEIGTEVAPSKIEIEYDGYTITE